DPPGARLGDPERPPGRGGERRDLRGLLPPLLLRHEHRYPLRALHAAPRGLGPGAPLRSAGVDGAGPGAELTGESQGRSGHEGPTSKGWFKIIGPEPGAAYDALGGVEGGGGYA